MANRHNKNSQGGFTLIEITIVLILSGIIIGMFSSGLMNFLRQSQISETKSRLEAVETALNQYLGINGKLPCPASLTVGVDDDGYGREVNIDCTAADAAGTFRADGRDPDAGGAMPAFRVRIGAVPARSIGLTDQHMMDSWGNRFFYAVVEQLATPAGYNRSKGAITVVDSEDNHVAIPADSAYYVIFSAGLDGIGGFNHAGIETSACPDEDDSLDAENCDRDARFLKTVVTSSADSADHFDDFIIFRTTTPADGATIPMGMVSLFTAVVCPAGWATFVGVVPPVGMIYCEKQ